MSTVVLNNRFDLDAFAVTALKASARLWFGVAVLGQLAFAFAIASFYGLTALRGDYHRWGKFITHGLVAGDHVGNFAIGVHLLSAVVVILAGALQLLPQVRARFPVFHRWNGRVYMLTAIALSIAGLYMMFARGSIGDGAQRVGSTLNAVLIWLCAGMALRYALIRDFSSHRRWALRLFLVVMGAWFFRAGFFLSLLVFQGPVGFDPTSFSGPLLTFMAFAQYLLPLAVLELYLRAQESGSALRRMTTAGTLSVLTLAMAAGIVAVTMAVWVPDVKAGFDTRNSIAEVPKVAKSPAPRSF